MPEVPAKRHMPLASGGQCPAGLATAKPGREGWAWEELWDLAIEADPNGLVGKSGFRGVFLIYANPNALARVAIRSTLAFVKRLVITSKCILLPTEAPIARLASLLEEIRASSIGACITVSLRGSSKELVDVVRWSVPGGVQNRRSCIGHVVIESVNDLVLIARADTTRSCGPSCSLYIDRGLVATNF